MAQQQFTDVRRHVALQGVGGVELGEHLCHVILRRCPIAQSRLRRFPDLLDRALAVDEADERVGSRRETVLALGAVILQDVPELTLIMMAMDLHVAAQARSKRSYAIPVLAV